MQIRRQRKEPNGGRWYVDFFKLELKLFKGKKCYFIARPGIEPRTPDLRVRCTTDCTTRPVYPRVGIPLSASETDDWLFFFYGSA